jgi:hypothetical protein
VGHPLDSQTMSPDLPVAFDGDFRSARYEQESLFMANFELGVVVIVDTFTDTLIIQKALPMRLRVDEETLYRQDPTVSAA